MSDGRTATADMRSLRFHEFGIPADVLRLERVARPTPGPGHVRVRVHSCGLTPADWALCQGLFPYALPRGIGLEVSGTVDEVGEGVVDVRVGDQVFGVPDWQNCPSGAGVAEFAVLTHYASVPPGLDLVDAAAMPMATETACCTLDCFGDIEGQTLLINGGGTTIGFAAVQMALMRGARVIATSGPTFADQLRSFGATVTPYGEGMVGRVREIAGGAPDQILETAPGGPALPDLIEIAGGEPSRVLTISSREAEKFGIRDNSKAIRRHDVLGEFALLASRGQYKAPPIAGIFKLEAWREAMAISQSGHAHGKLIIQPNE